MEAELGNIMKIAATKFIRDDVQKKNFLDHNLLDPNLLPSSASTQLNSTSTSIEAEVSLISC